MGQIGSIFITTSWKNYLTKNLTKEKEEGQSFIFTNLIISHCILIIMLILWLSFNAYYDMQCLKFFEFHWGNVLSFNLL